MNNQQVYDSTCGISSFCANDPVFTAKRGEAGSTQPCDLPGHQDLITDLRNHLSSPRAADTSLVLIGLSPFEAEYHSMDDQIRLIASLGASVKLAQSVGRASTNIQHSRSETETTTSQLSDSGEGTQATVMQLYQLTSLQFAITTRSGAKTLSALCTDILNTLSPPIYIGDLPVKTSPCIGIAHQQSSRPQGLLRAARSALHSSRQHINKINRID